MDNQKIDFVIIWVDGSDEEWLKEKSKYSPGVNVDDSIQRFRDWENLQYWFRGVEKFAPWVNNIYFVTWGHLPKWLNTNNKKLKIINHKDYIPKEYLPTFSSHTIELNLHRIEGLSENFVYFNDDMFIIDKMKPTDFFIDNLPCDSAVLNVHCYSDEMFVLAPFRAVGILNKYFNFKEVLKQKPLNWFNLKYGFKMLNNIYLLPCPRFPGFYQQHLPSTFKKQTFEKLWELEFETFNDTCLRKFRSIQDLNQWVFKEWQLADNKFVPRKTNIGSSISLGEPKKAYNYIKSQKGQMLCINDTSMDTKTFLETKNMINEAFEKILPEKSSFEL